MSSPVSPLVILGPLYLISTEALGQSIPRAAVKTWPGALDPPSNARRQRWAREDLRGHPSAAETHFSRLCHDQDPEVQNLKRAPNKVSVYKVSEEPNRRLHLPQFCGDGGLQLWGPLVSSVSSAFLPQTRQHLTLSTFPSLSIHPSTSSILNYYPNPHIPP